MEPDVNEPKPLSNQELNAFMSGLSFYLSSERPEPEKMSLGQAIVRDKMDYPEQLDFYQLFEQYKQQGHSAEEAVAKRRVSARNGLEGNLRKT